MKLNLLTIFVLFISNAQAQNITSRDFDEILSCFSQNAVSNKVKSKGWEFETSETENNGKILIYTYSYNKSSYNDKASGWMKVYFYNKNPISITCQFFNQTSYDKFIGSVSPEYKYVESKNESGSSKTKYISGKYILKIVREGSYSSDKTTYLDIAKRNSFYDEKNGKKTLYDDYDRKKVEYVLRDGVIEGEVINYYGNGNIETIGNYKNGEKNGLFKEYDRYGSLETSYYVINGKITGEMNVYEEKKLVKKLTMVNNEKNGLTIEYTYAEDGELFLESHYNYIEGELNGKCTVYYIDPSGSKKQVSYINYKDNVLDGPFQEISGDSIIVSTYKNGKLHGTYEVFRNLKSVDKSSKLSGLSKPDLICKGSYSYGNKTGYWKVYYNDRTLNKTEEYENGRLNGEVKYYLPTVYDENGQRNKMSGKLYLVENYKNGMKNGLSKRLYNAEFVPYNCEGNDTCYKMETEKVSITSYYENGILNGIYSSYDSLGRLQVKGNVINGKENGEWIYGEVNYSNDSLSYSVVYDKGNFKFGEKEGKWINYNEDQTVNSTCHYKNGRLVGSYVKYENDRETSRAKYDQGKVADIHFFNNAGQKYKEYQIFNVNDDFYSCREIRYNNNDVKSIKEFRFDDSKDLEYLDVDYTLLFKAFGFIRPETNYLHGKYYELYVDSLEINGTYENANQKGLWEYTDLIKNVKYVVDYNKESGDNSSNKIYYNLDGSKYTGNYENVSNEGNIVLNEIKNGLLHGSVTVLDKNTNEIIEVYKYKKGVRK